MYFCTSLIKRAKWCTALGGQPIQCVKKAAGDVITCLMFTHKDPVRI